MIDFSNLARKDDDPKTHAEQASLPATTAATILTTLPHTNDEKTKNTHSKNSETGECQ